MGRHHSSRKLSDKKSMRKPSYPKVSIDREHDYLSVKLAPGIESKSYLKRGFLFSEDKNGRVIEIQLLNMSDFGKSKRKRVA